MPGSTFKKRLVGCKNAAKPPPPAHHPTESHERKTTWQVWQLGRDKIIWFGFVCFFYFPVIEIYTDAKRLQRWRLLLPNIVFSWQLIRPLTMPEWQDTILLKGLQSTLYTYISARAKRESFRFPAFFFLNWLTSFSICWFHSICELLCPMNIS